ncbi:pectinesterase inhibitor 10-like [Juglans microcarpa x Juglans regia]|uniref:pectinesterase inhibitor 10-like n=1 Tax=Juglans microcarpa x Juglans regia TaxID=2249226 RepID=UPI001B7E96E9|nr:pectinesterase inhibitor 10-like [Juglans microcarpa x Juglans regia]
MESHKNIKAIPALPMIILISFFYPIFFHSAQAICVPRNNTFGSASSPLSSSTPKAYDPPVSHIAANPSSISDHSPESAPSSSPQPSTSPDAHPPVSHISAPSPASYLSPESAPTPSHSPGPRLFSHLPSKPTPTPIISPNPAPTPDIPAAPKSSQPSITPAPLISEAPFNSPLNPAIKKICEATDYPLVCLASTAPFLTGKVDVISVLEVAVKACSLHAKIALSIASKVLKTEQSISASVSDCMDMYDDVLDNIESAVDALSARDTGTFNAMLSAVLTDYGTCEDGFAGERSPLSEVDDKGTKLASNCLAIASLIK